MKGHKRIVLVLLGIILAAVFTIPISMQPASAATESKSFTYNGQQYLLQKSSKYEWLEYTYTNYLYRVDGSSKILVASISDKEDRTMGFVAVYNGKAYFNYSQVDNYSAIYTYSGNDTAFRLYKSNRYIDSYYNGKIVSVNYLPESKTKSVNAYYNNLSNNQEYSLGKMVPKTNGVANYYSFINNQFYYAVDDSGFTKVTVYRRSISGTSPKLMTTIKAGSKYCIWPKKVYKDRIVFDEDYYLSDFTYSFPNVVTYYGNSKRAKKKSAKATYKKYLAQKKILMPYGGGSINVYLSKFKFQVVDLDRNKVPELVMRGRTSVGRGYLLFTYRNGRLQLADYENGIFDAFPYRYYPKDKVVCIKTLSGWRLYNKMNGNKYTQIASYSTKYSYNVSKYKRVVKKLHRAKKFKWKKNTKSNRARI